MPLYLLVDRFDGLCRESTTVRFGKPVALPEPFGLEIGTDAF